MLLEDPTIPAIFEGAFEHNGVLVRVDILERLADLIRPALSWREGAPGPKPDGFFDGRSFVISGAMTSLTGASGEDFASILRSVIERANGSAQLISTSTRAALSACTRSSASRSSA